MEMSKAEYNYVAGWAKKIKAINSLGGCCQDCGKSNIFILCFHHHNKSLKTINLSQLRNIAWSKWKKEILKCDLLCCNCHYSKHFTPNEIKNNLIQIIGIDACEECKYNGTALDFHHVDEDKKFNFGDITGKKIRVPLEVIISEMEKCCILCRNCHMVEHIEIDKFMRLKPEIYKRVKSYREQKCAVDKKQVAMMLSQGFSQSEIGRKLGYAKSTICGVVKYLRN